MGSQEALRASPSSAKGPALKPGKLSPGPGRAPAEVAAHQLARIYDATIELVAQSGYKALKVRDIVARAEVSTRAFYEHFAGKEDCFLQAYELIARRASRRIVSAQAGEPEWRKRPQLVFEAFIAALEKEVAGARLALIEAYTAGEAALALALRAERNLEGMLAEAFARTPKGVVVPPLIVQGMVAGVATVSRNRLLEGKVADLANDGGGLIDWAMRYPDPLTAELSRLDRQSVWRDTMLEPRPAGEEDGLEPARGDRALILRAVAELAATKGYAGLAVSHVRAAAGISRRKFAAHFDDLEDCYLAAIEQRAAAALAQAARAQTSASSAPGGVYRAIAALVDCFGKDPFLSRVCLTDEFPETQAGRRAKKRLTDAILELRAEQAPIVLRSGDLAMEASSGAVWSLVRRYVLPSREPTPISASLVYLYLAPAIGPAATVRAIEREQSP